MHLASMHTIAWALWHAALLYIAAVNDGFPKKFVLHATQAVYTHIFLAVFQGPEHRPLPGCSIRIHLLPLLPRGYNTTGEKTAMVRTHHHNNRVFHFSECVCYQTTIVLWKTLLIYPWGLILHLYNLAYITCALTVLYCDLFWRKETLFTCHRWISDDQTQFCTTHS